MVKERASMSDLGMDMGELPTAPIPIRVHEAEPKVDRRAEPKAEPRVEPEPEQGREPMSGVYIPPAEVREPLVSWSCRMPLRLRTQLESIAEEYRIDMTKIVVDLLEIHLPRIPTRRKRA